MGCASLAVLAIPQQSGFDQERAWKDLVKQVAFGPRASGTEAQITCRDWLLDQLKPSCDNVRTQEFSHKWSKTGKDVTLWNVLAEQNWDDATTRVLLIAHWDSRPSADQDPVAGNRTRAIPGANDGASGVAVLLELARTMKGKLPKGVGVMYLLTDGEDLGPELSEMFLGAVYFSKNLPEKKPDYGILLDMIGDKDLQVPVEPYSLQFAPKLTLALYDHARAIGLGSTFPRQLGPEIMDDHHAISHAGVPTVDLIDFDYASWHTVDDTADKCSADALGKVGKLLETWLLKDPAYRIKE